MSFSASMSHSDGTGTRYHNVSGPSHGEAGSCVALAFNPGGDKATDKVKLAHAVAMQTLIDERNTTAKPDETAPAAEHAAYGAKMRCIATALTHLETAQMFGVKALHTRSNAGLSD